MQNEQPIVIVVPSVPIENKSYISLKNILFSPPKLSQPKKKITRTHTVTSSQQYQQVLRDKEHLKDIAIQMKKKLKNSNLLHRTPTVKRATKASKV